MLYNVTKIYVFDNKVLYIDEGEISRNSANYNKIDVITPATGYGIGIAFELPNGVYTDEFALTQETSAVGLPEVTSLQAYQGEQWSSYTMIIPNAVLSAITSTTSQTLGFSLRFTKGVTNLESYDEKDDFPSVGLADKVYFDDELNDYYIWDGTAYVEKTSTEASALIVSFNQAYSTERAFLSIQGTVGGEPLALDPAFYQSQIVSKYNELVSLYNQLKSSVGDPTTGLAQKVTKSGDTMTGQLDFSTVDLDELQTPLAAIKLGGNNVTTSGKINDYTFDSGQSAEGTLDALKYANLADLFNLGTVTPTGEENILEAYTRALTDKFAAIQTVEDLSEILLKRDGTNAMTGNLDMGGQSITNVNLVDGVDLETIGGQITTLQNEVSSLQGAYILRGSVTESTEDLNTSGTQPLTDYIAANFDSRSPETGDVLRDSTGGEWYYDGTNWTFVGQAYIDLDNYYTKTVSDSRYYTQTQLDPMVDDNGTPVTDFSTEAELDNRYYTEVEADNLLAGKVDVGVLASSIVIYPTDTPSGVSNYVRGVTSIDDADYDTTAVDVTTPVVNNVKVPVGSVIADANLFLGNPGVISVPIVGNVRSSANNVEAEFYFEIYKRDSSGVETLIGEESTKTRTVTNLSYEEFNATALLNNGLFVETDRLVFKFFADKKGSVDGTFDFQYGGGSPVRILLNVPIDVTLQAERLSYDNTGTNITETNVQTAITELDTQDTTIQNNLTNHINDTTAAHAASAISFDPTGVPLVTTDVQAAIAELFENGKIKSDFIELQFEDIIQGYYDTNTDAFYEEDTFTTEITAFDSKSVFVDLTSNDLYRYDALATPKFIRVIEVAGTLGDLSDVVVTGASNGEFLKFDGSNWVNATIPTINTLGDIGNVDTTGAVTGSVIKYDATVNAGAGGWVVDTDDTGTTISTLDDIGDVSVSTATATQFIRRNATNDAWENHSLVKADVGLDSVENYPIANQTDVDNSVTNKYMTPSITEYSVNNNYSKGVIESNATTDTGFWVGTQAEYDAIGTYDDNTLYFIKG